jgi:predicted dithiol-disulfide oxidoreductase (DUF899 family)
MTEHRLGTQEEWQAKRNELLTEERELTHRSDELYRDRQLASLSVRVLADPQGGDVSRVDAD